MEESTSEIAKRETLNIGWAITIQGPGKDNT